MEEAVRMVKWISPEDDFETLFKNGEYEKIVRLSEENEELLYSLYHRKENDNLGKSIKFGLFLMKYFKRLFVEEIQKLGGMECWKTDGVFGAFGAAAVFERTRSAGELQCEVQRDKAP